ncbi:MULTISPECIES: acyl carrier protein [unclassified Streptomyces]|uniref:acyl carrier protein n=1 Tax=unclassified Streptomyces TaxID=2593676 RepID=UPI0033BFA3FE
MAQTPWNAKFETILRQGLPGLGKDKAPAADVPMETYGLDSLALIGIVSTLESVFAVSLAGQVTVPVRTLTAGQLWGVLSAALQPAWDMDLPAAPGSRGRSPSPWAVA